MDKYAIIVAGGSGQRMGTTVPKQFLLLHGKPLLQYTLKAFIQAFADVKLILVLPKEHIEKGREVAVQLDVERNIVIATGGETRFHSVKQGLQFVTHPSIVFVHDGVRCMVSEDLITRCYEQALEKGSAVPAVAATDSIRIANGASHATIDRNHVRIIQTPQTFNSQLLTKAFDQPYQESFTDEATAVEAIGEEVFLIEGSYDNLKVTRPVDLLLAEKLLLEQASL